MLNVILIVNATLAAVNNEDQFVSQSGMRNLLTRVRKEKNKHYEKNKEARFV